MQNKAFNFGPVALSATTTTNILNPPAASGGVGAGSSGQYIILKHIRVVNKSSASQRFALWKGATGGNAAGTEVIAGGTATAGSLDASVGVAVAAGAVFDWYGLMRFDVADFLVGGASAATSLTIQGEGEIGVTG